MENFVYLQGSLLYQHDPVHSGLIRSEHFQGSSCEPKGNILRLNHARQVPSSVVIQWLYMYIFLERPYLCHRNSKALRSE